MNNTEMSNATLQAVDLHLFLFERPLHPELFQRYATFRVEQGRYHADIWIIGLSHVLSLTIGSKCLTEVLSREGDVPASRGVVTRFRLKGERDHERSTPDGWNYMVSTQVETMDEALYKSVHNDLLRHTEKRGWFQAYEHMADGDLVPFTYMDHEARDREFHLHAFHAFPAERTLVKTQSIIELPG
ncbi:MAG: DUF2617 family protein [Phycisphaerales bacterium]|nr:DUF2617 family protein [Phycisphaerales bacterium]